MSVLRSKPVVPAAGRRSAASRLSKIPAAGRLGALVSSAVCPIASRGGLSVGARSVEIGGVDFAFGKTQSRYRVSQFFRRTRFGCGPRRAASTTLEDEDLENHDPGFEAPLRQLPERFVCPELDQRRFPITNATFVPPQPVMHVPGHDPGIDPCIPALSLLDYPYRARPSRARR